MKSQPIRVSRRLQPPGSSTELSQLRDDGEICRAYIGFQVRNIGFDESQKLQVAGGVFIGDVAKGSAAHKAGFRRGDVVVRVDGRETKLSRDLVSYVSAKVPGAVVNLEIVRAGSMITRSVTLGERQDEPGLAKAKR
jgi:serine protease Do